VSGSLGIVFPPVVVWRPRDQYYGLGQLEALTLFKRLSGSYDLVQYAEAESKLKDRISTVQESISILEAEKGSIERMHSFLEAEDQKKERIKEISRQQMQVREKAGFSELVRDLGLLENVKKVMDIYPSMIDYAVNIGLENVGSQWVSFLEDNGSLVSDVKLETELDRFVCAFIEALPRELNV
jgi:hypothetical protein